MRMSGWVEPPQSGQVLCILNHWPGDSGSITPISYIWLAWLVTKCQSLSSTYVSLQSTKNSSTSHGWQCSLSLATSLAISGPKYSDARREQSTGIQIFQVTASTTRKQVLRTVPWTSSQTSSSSSFRFQWFGAYSFHVKRKSVFHWYSWVESCMLRNTCDSCCPNNILIFGAEPVSWPLYDMLTSSKRTQRMQNTLFGGSSTQDPSHFPSIADLLAAQSRSILVLCVVACQRSNPSSHTWYQGLVGRRPAYQNSAGVTWHTRHARHARRGGAPGPDTRELLNQSMTPCYSNWAGTEVATRAVELRRDVHRLLDMREKEEGGILLRSRKSMLGIVSLCYSLRGKSKRVDTSHDTIRQRPILARRSLNTTLLLFSTKRRFIVAIASVSSYLGSPNPESRSVADPAATGLTPLKPHALLNSIRQRLGGTCRTEIKQIHEHPRWPKRHCRKRGQLWFM